MHGHLNETLYFNFMGFVPTSTAILMSKIFAELNNILLYYDILAVVISKHNILPNPDPNPCTLQPVCILSFMMLHSNVLGFL